MRKKVDSRIRTLVENCVKTRQRSLFVIVGDKGRDQVGGGPLGACPWAGQGPGAGARCEKGPTLCTECDSTAGGY